VPTTRCVAEHVYVSVAVGVIICVAQGSSAPLSGLRQWSKSIPAYGSVAANTKPSPPLSGLSTPHSSRAQGSALQPSSKVPQVLGSVVLALFSVCGSIGTLLTFTSPVRWLVRFSPRQSTHCGFSRSSPGMFTTCTTLELFRNKRQGKLSSQKAMEGANRWVCTSETIARCKP
jgi:hypothetical protein